MSDMETETTGAVVRTTSRRPVKATDNKTNLHNVTGDFGITTSPDHEQFVGFKLSAEDKEFVWDPEVTPVKTSLLSGGPSISQVNQYSRLLVKQAILSPDAAMGEVNCVEVEGSFPRSLNKMPLAVLSGGRDMQRYLDVYFPEPPLTFRLTHGNGPVFILAQSMMENSPDDSDDSDVDTADDETGAEDTADTETGADTADSSMEEEEADYDEEEEEAEAEESPVKPKKSKAGKAAAKAKVEPEVEDEDEEEESEEEVEPSPPKKKGKAAGKAKGKPAKAVTTEDEESEEEEPPKKKGRASKAKPKAGKKGKK